jgi:4-hydroxyacetophenone monooxygenase
MSVSDPLVVEDELGDAVAAAHLPSLLAALSYLTGDLTLVDPELRPDPEKFREFTGGLSPERLVVARERAVRALLELRERNGGVGDRGTALDDATLAHLAGFVVGADIDVEYLPLLRDELAVDEDRGAPDWRLDELAPGTDFRVAVIGAGMSGIAAAHRLGQAGIPYVVVEKNLDVGGTWCENQYPGCRVDVPNHAYSYSFAQRADWPYHFSPQSVLLDYFRGCADSLGVRPHIRFGTEVIEATFDEPACAWEVRTRDRDGVEEVLRVNAVISCVGQLNRPKLPDIPGRDEFSGPAFHTARWDHGVDIRGRRVAVVGTGASAIQVIPTIAPEVGELLVFQRSPNWLVPNAAYHAPLPEGFRTLLEAVPTYPQWYRMMVFWYMSEGMLPAADVDPDWPASGRIGGPRNEAMREFLTAYLEQQFADRPDLVAALTPSFPPLATRPLVDDGVLAEALTRDHVGLVTTPIDRIDATGIVTADGERHDVDVIVFATGFEASRFLAPMRVRGRGGLDLQDDWAGEPRAYLGIQMPGFPNFFSLYGPNTNIVANGSIIFFSEAGIHYILACLHSMLTRGAAALDVRREVHDTFNEWVDAGNRARVWGAADVSTWYKNERGRVTQNWPFSLVEYWQLTRTPGPDDHEYLHGTDVPVGTSA